MGKSAKEKLEFVKTAKLCYNCLDRHHIKDCKTTKICLVSNSKHHTMLHDALNRSTSSSANQSTSLTTAASLSAAQNLPVKSHQMFTMLQSKPFSAPPMLLIMTAYY